MIVALSWFELYLAAQVGAMRRIEAIKTGRRHKYGRPDGDEWGDDIAGAAAELAVAKATGEFWHALARKPQELPGDVGRRQVRWTEHKNGHLLMHEDDKDDAEFVLVTGKPPTLTIVGTIVGALGKQDGFWGDPYCTGRPAFWVPQSELWPWPTEVEAVA